MNDQLPLFDRKAPPLPPGEYIRNELDKRGWTQAELAAITKKPLASISSIIMGKRRIIPEVAVALGLAFGTTPDIWMIREAAYRLSRVAQDNSGVSNRTKLYTLAPIKEMQKRHWINRTKSTFETEKELCRFFEVDSIEDEPPLIANARRRSPNAVFTPAQKAWIYRAAKLARTVPAKRYYRRKTDGLVAELRNLSKLAKCVEDVSWVLADYGIRLVVVEQISRSKIDGAAFWINRNSPVIALSVRYDRLDYFWFTMMHELAHIYHQDGLMVDKDYGKHNESPREECEQRANEQAAAWLVDPKAIDSFVLRVRPLFNRKKIIQFANRIDVHPAIVVGQLQHRGDIPFSSSRSMLIKVRDLLTNRTLTDGWGTPLPTLA